MKKILLINFLIFCQLSFLKAQDLGWQQRVEYEMEIDFDVNIHQFDGNQKLTYYNNSPDTLKRVFYHLFFNAFQPGSMMDVRSRTIKDPDPRVRDRILHLKENEIGFQKISSLKQDGKDLNYKVVGTILEVELDKPLLPGKRSVFKMEFKGQVPKQIRRSGRDNKEGIAYTMTQWFPKMAEYDYEGWHANPYIGREFHGVWGDFDVKITIDENFTIGGSGYLQNGDKIGHGYNGIQDKLPGKNGKHTWHFVAPNVHDFAWAADPDYRHTILKMEDGPELHFFYQADTLVENWERLPEYTKKHFELAGSLYGKYPYKQYSVIQGGDGGMEYAMCTMITGHRKLPSLVGVTVHEAMHSWFQHIFAFNETKYAWMDEGFTSYASNIIEDKLFNENKFYPHYGSFSSYKRLVDMEMQEPLTTHSDFYTRNGIYGVSSYSKGALFLSQMEYIIGKSTFDKAMLRFYNEWKFKHPKPIDLLRIFEKESEIELNWYLEQWIGTTNTIDYGLKSVESEGNGTAIVLERVGNMPMPVDVYVEYTDGKIERFNIPLRIMRGVKQEEFNGISNKQLESWPWTYPEYKFTLEVSPDKIKTIEIDMSMRMADIDRSNNYYPEKENPVTFPYIGK
ncbi:M1 family metallopeptidase [Flexithrix dorotheae]|uniref:M1 family metallopeptidase n=1 Tax=Flexithrix dorotheae TaxID=70993 RepID=UPI0005C43B20|nr:M1 family metallopeptidase [Flexithrix dorotheae]